METKHSLLRTRAEVPNKSTGGTAAKRCRFITVKTCLYLNLQAKTALRSFEADYLALSETA